MSKLIARLNVTGRGSIGSVVLDNEGVQTKLDRVTRIVIDNEGNFTVAMWTEMFDGEFEISNATADAILRCNARKQLSFIDDSEVDQLRKWRAKLHGEMSWPGGPTPSESAAALRVLDKLMEHLPQ